MPRLAASASERRRRSFSSRGCMLRGLIGGSFLSLLMFREVRMREWRLPSLVARPCNATHCDVPSGQTALHHQVEIRATGERRARRHPQARRDCSGCDALFQIPVQSTCASGAQPNSALNCEFARASRVSLSSTQNPSREAAITQFQLVVAQRQPRRAGIRPRGTRLRVRGVDLIPVVLDLPCRFGMAVAVVPVDRFDEDSLECPMP